ncbi:hypothetical protein ACWGKW_15540 [Streptomyces sp. NPDC054766]|uniref:hypothetical protein n=1 Tax=Streptomyces rhizosphaerihabitans TaxID=1266770 RepID=UPI0021BEDE34|nr:hypothetical protein [Streptomyces rhizosphaerihabitans]MCT9006696.1 hypothetical protein [Streptomyces rhizosphaerihabitans]
MMEPGLFELEAVVVEQPERSRWRRYVGPALAVSTVEGTLLAQVTHPDDTHSLLAKTSGECIVRIKRRSRFGQFGPVRFHFTDSADLEVGTAVARGVVKTLRLTLQTEQGRQLLLTRWGHLSAEWLLTETDPRRSPAPEILGRVTVSDVDAWLGLQRYAVETDPRLDASERRTVVASVVCLHLLRRPPGGSAAPA